MSDVFSNGFFRGVELAIIIAIAFGGLYAIIAFTREMFGADQ
jgi:hypothetical protein